MLGAWQFRMNSSPISRRPGTTRSSPGPCSSRACSTRRSVRTSFTSTRMWTSTRSTGTSTAFAITPTRLLIAHMDDDTRTAPAGPAAARDDVVGGDRAGRHPHRPHRTDVRAARAVRAPGQPPVEVSLTLGWGSTTRIDTFPEACTDPQCDADHGYGGSLLSEDLTLRVSAQAEGPEAVARAEAFAVELRRPHSARPATGAEQSMAAPLTIPTPDYAGPLLSDVLPAAALAVGAEHILAPEAVARAQRIAPDAVGQDGRRRPDRRTGLAAAAPPGGAHPVPAVPAAGRDAAERRLPVDHGEFPVLACDRHAAGRARRHGLHAAGPRTR